MGSVSRVSTSEGGSRAHVAAAGVLNGQVTASRWLDIDCASACAEIEAAMREIVGRRLRRRGIVMGVSGGIDSSVCAALAARALGKDRVLALFMPERDSSPSSTAKGRMLCESLGIQSRLEDLTPALTALGCYRWQNQAIRQVFPQFKDGDRFKIIVAGNLLESDRLNYFSLVVQSEGEQHTMRLPLDAYLEMVAATNMKQRVRKLMEYSHADRLNYAVLGTPNRLEYDQGFFVRGGDGLADFKPIAHLYKSQVFAIARHLGLPREICEQTPTTDTYSLPQTQTEFYFALPYQQMDLLLYAYVNGIGAADAAKALNLNSDQVQRAFRDIDAKRRVSMQLHQPALLVHEHDWSAGGESRGAG